MMRSYRGYTILPRPVRKCDNRWAVGVEIGHALADRTVRNIFRAEDGVEYLLEVEAAKEGINLARNLIDRDLVGF
jgi:hypothetical protein